MQPLPGLTEEEMDAWLAFLRAHADVTSTLDRDLVQEHGASLSEYEVLAFLSRAPGERMRMSALAGAVMISPAALTRRVDGLVRNGLVRRERGEEDSRVVYTVLTAEGRRLLKRLSPTHVAGIRRHFADVLSPRELEQVARALWKVARSCR